MANPGFSPTTGNIGVTSNNVPQGNRSIKVNQQSGEENRNKSGYQRESGMNQNASTRGNVTRLQEPSRTSATPSAPSRSVTPNAEKPMDTNTLPSRSRPSVSTPSRSSSSSVTPSRSSSSSVTPSRSSSSSATPSRSSSSSATPSRSSSSSATPSRSSSSSATPSRSSSPSTSSSSSSGGRRR